VVPGKIVMDKGTRMLKYLIIGLMGLLMVALPAMAQPSSQPELTIRSITVVEQKEFSKKKKYHAEEVKIISPHYLDTPEFMQSLQSTFIGKKFTVEEAKKIVDVTVAFAHAHQRPVVDVYIPQQDITGGNLVVVVDTSHLGAVKIEGNGWLSDAMLQGEIGLAKGAEIDSEALERDMVWLNKSPFHHIEPVLTPGAQEGETDLLLKTQDRIPFRPYMGFDNSGNDATSPNRIRAGFALGDLPTYNSLLNYEYAQAPEYHTFWSHSLNYSLALPSRDTLFAGASYSRSQANLGDFNSGGTNIQTQLGYKLDLRPNNPVKGLIHDVSAGIEYKSLGSNLQFGGAQVYQSRPEVNQLFTDYNALLPDSYGSALFNLKMVASPGGISSHNTDENFDLAREGASASYMYAQGRLERTITLPQGFSFKARGAGQLASTNLLGSEQIVITDHDNVRGYDEDALVSDEGYRLNLELFTPEAHPAQMFGAGNISDALQGLAFLDHGYGTAKFIKVDSDKGEYVTSAGVGVRYHINSNFYAQADYGVPLKKLHGNDDPHAYFSLVIAY